MEKLYDRCLRCNRKLKTEEARKLGYGKICYQKLGKGYKVIRLLDIDYTNYKWRVNNEEREKIN